MRSTNMIAHRYDAITRRVTAFDTWRDLLNGSTDGTVTGYCPSLRVSTSRDAKKLADRYDRAQARAGDPVERIDPVYMHLEW